MARDRAAVVDLNIGLLSLSVGKKILLKKSDFYLLRRSRRSAARKEEFKWSGRRRRLSERSFNDVQVRLHLLPTSVRRRRDRRAHFGASHTQIDTQADKQVDGHFIINIIRLPLSFFTILTIPSHHHPIPPRSHITQWPAPPVSSSHQASAALS